MMQIMSALESIQGSLNSFISAYPSLASNRATVDRIWAFWEGVDHSVEKVQNSTVLRGVCGSQDRLALEAKNIVVALPGKRLLWHKANLRVPLGGRVLLLGKDGC